MAKKNRIARRGKTVSMIRKFPTVARTSWKKHKTAMMYVTRNQYERDHEAFESQWLEIELEQGGRYVVIEASQPLIPTFIVTEYN